MRFALTSDHTDFAASIDSLLGKADLPAVIRSWNTSDTAPGLTVWERLAETGVTALTIAEEHGGMGADAIDLVVAIEQLGRHAVPGPVAETLAVAPALLAAVAPERLEALAEGALATVAAPPETPFAVDSDAASLTLLVTGNDVSVGTPGSSRQSVDLARKLFEVTAGESLGTIDDAALAAAFDLGALATAAQLQGLGRTMLDVSVEYAKARKQFGRAIGSLQAIKHHLAEVAVAVEMAAPLLHAAAMAVRDGSPTARRDVSAAKVACAEAAYKSSRVALQVHGAIGYTQEHDLSLYLTRTRALLTAWGTPAAHRARVLAAL
ncbi:acyl-CoA dehydrogenase [Tomitella biformata]|uniref:acyl-CoA dehydrogenase n=1 Tax=Tomitella biformata TaxID=630403 RepID=UPI000464A93F|nr:acyl-CoA dehydrogenase [Tomitella biformata]